MNELTDRNVATVAGWAGRAVAGERSTESSVACVGRSCVKGRKGTPPTLVCPDTNDLLLHPVFLKSILKMSPGYLPQKQVLNHSHVKN